jgi:hypothetical protein
MQNLDQDDSEQSSIKTPYRNRNIKLKLPEHSFSDKLPENPFSTYLTNVADLSRSPIIPVIG